MAIVFPSSAIARRWNGALTARLMRAPLEQFLRSRGIAAAGAGVGQDTDDVTRAAVQMIGTALTTLSADRPAGIRPDEAIVAHLSCIVTRSLATLIQKPDVWRIAALLCTAQILSPWLGLTDAALTSAAYIRRFESAPPGDAALDAELAQAAIGAVTDDASQAFKAAAARVASCLGAAYSTRLNIAAVEMQALSAWKPPAHRAQ